MRPRPSYVDQRVKTLVAMAAIVSTVALSAQDRTAPTRGDAAVERLSVFVGHWHTDAEMKPGPFGPGGAFTSDDQLAWMDGRRFVVGEAHSTTPFGKQFQLTILGYDTRQQVYTFSAFNSGGVRTAATGQVAGDTWTWTSPDNAIRQTITIVSSTRYTFVSEISMDNGSTWLPFVAGQVRKTD